MMKTEVDMPKSKTPMKALPTLKSALPTPEIIREDSRG